MRANPSFLRRQSSPVPALFHPHSAPWVWASRLPRASLLALQRFPLPRLSSRLKHVASLLSLRRSRAQTLSRSQTRPSANRFLGVRETGSCVFSVMPCRALFLGCIARRGPLGAHSVTAI